MTASVINATVNGINATGGNTAELELQVGGTTAITVNSAGYWVLDNALPAASGGTGINSAGTAGNVLTSNGTAWVSQAAPSTGGNASYDTLTAATGFFDLPSGTTAQRPVSPAVGMIRYNTTESEYEVYSGTTWTKLAQTLYSYSIEYLVIAGGGGGAGDANPGGGGGAGGGGANGYSAISGSAVPQSGTANTGGGGGGVGWNGTAGQGTGGAGGSGIVILRYSGIQRGSGGTVYSSGGYTYHKFTSSGTYTA